MLVTRILAARESTLDYERLTSATKTMPSFTRKLMPEHPFVSASSCKARRASAGSWGERYCGGAAEVGGECLVLAKLGKESAPELHHQARVEETLSCATQQEQQSPARRFARYLPGA